MFEIKKVITIRASTSHVFKALISSNEIPIYYTLKKVKSTWNLGL
ncbi:MAG: hypothetical protein ACI8Y3_000051 [Paraglaciecola sp.]|jgi:hypothetical protein